MLSSDLLVIPVNKFVFTSADIAAIMGVAPRTVAKWIDAKRMKGSRRHGTLIRLVTLPNLLTFLRTHNYKFTQEEV